MGGHGEGADEPDRWIGPYRVVAPLGEGGMGTVHLGRDARGRPAAVKVLRGELARDESMVRRFRREAEAAAAVRGPGVAPLLGYDLDGPVPWIAAAYLAGPTLQEAVAAHGPFTEAGTRALVAELARAVAVIHAAGLVHRDLKPSNIVLTRSGARIIDFGIARPEYGLTLTEPGVAPATPGYAPPEQITGRRAGPPADVFALGAVLVFACAARGPFGSGHPAAVGYRVVHDEPDLEGVPDALTPVAQACLAKEAGRRPVPEVLAGWVEGAGFGAVGTGAPEPPTTRRGPVPWVLRLTGRSRGRGGPEPWPASTPGASAGPVPEASGGPEAEAPTARRGAAAWFSPLTGRRRLRGAPETKTPAGRPSEASWALRLTRRRPPHPHPQPDAPWLTAPVATEIDRRAVEAERLLRTVAPAGRVSRRSVLAGGAAVSVAGTGAGVWWLTRDRPADPGPRTENGVPVAAPLARPTADTVPAALWRAEGLHPAGPGPVTAGRVVAAGTPRGVAAWVQHTGRPAWSWTGAEAPDRHGHLLVSGTALLVVTADGRLTALDSRTGKARWRTGALGAAQTLAADGTTAYLLDRERHVVAVDLTDRRLRWTSARPLGGTGTARAATTRQRLMVTTDDGVAQVLDTRTGKESWRWDFGQPTVLGQDPPSVAPAPAVHDGCFCVGGRPLALLDAHTGKARWTVGSDTEFHGAPTVAAGRVYSALPAELWCLDAESGDSRWTAPVVYGGVPLTADVVVGHALYGRLGNPAESGDGIGTDEGVFTVDIRSGRLLWTFGDQAEQDGWRLTGAAGRVFVSRGTTLRAMPTL